MIQKINNAIARNTLRGQTALVLILLTAAALIFLAITLNWGRIAQTKALLTTSVDEAATLLASDTASYGEMEKQTYLHNTNYFSASTGGILSIIMVVISVIMIFIPGLNAVGLTLAIAATVMAVVNLVLQAVVVQPGITSMWNQLQKDQPVQQQYYEQGVAAALQGSVTDQAQVTDYLDWNANGVFGLNASGFPKDAVSRFAVFYHDRLVMLNQANPLIPQVVFFYDQLGELMDGETCGQNQNDNYNYGLTVLPQCQNLGILPFTNITGGGACTPGTCTTSGINCVTSQSPLCQVKIPNLFQLNDGCPADSNTGDATYNPYCDPCCVPPIAQDPAYNAANPSSSDPTPFKALRPSNCSMPSAMITPGGDCNPSNPGANPNAADCLPIQSANECLQNNPYNPYGVYPYIYDASYQNYTAGLSFLAKYGRDQQMGPFTTAMTPQGNFPNGIYPFFWLLQNYGLEVDNINPATTPLVAGPPASPDLHWCSPATAGVNGVNIPTSAAPLTGFPDLTQLGTAPYTLPYTCLGPDCCVNYVAAGTGGAFDVMDMVGSPAFPYNPPYYNPAQDPSFGQGEAGAWLPGDSQLCLSPANNWPYNGSSTTGAVDGTCEWNDTGGAPLVPPNPSYSTVDGLDDTMHTLSDFVIFANTLLGKDVGTLSSTLQGWYPQAAGWIDPTCDDGSTCGATTPGLCSDQTTCGRLLSIYNPYTGLDLLNTWNGIITKWLNVNYSSPSPSSAANAWCVPPESILLNGNASTSEDTYINTNSTGQASWGDLTHVIACLNYNSGAAIYNGTTQTGPIYNYQQCLNYLTSTTMPPVCCDDNSICSVANLCTDGTACVSTLTGTPCDPSVLGRSLAGPAPVFDGCAATGNYVTWVNQSLALATHEAPKFALRSAFLSDLYSRAQSFQQILYQGDQALSAFLAPCAGANCANGGPAAQLTYAYNQNLNNTSTTATLPNSVIYGWQDNAPSGGSGGCTDSTGNRVGCSHIVKVTAYSVARNGNISNNFISSLLPWIKTKASFFTRSFTLTNRDGYVFASVRRWDEDHSNPILFPNGHSLWQFMFHNPNGGQLTSGEGLAAACDGLVLPNGGSSGYGLLQSTVIALGLPSVGISTQDEKSFSHAFMLNDQGSGPNAGKVDPYAASPSQVSGVSYCGCLAMANSLLTTNNVAPESHACAEYVASINATGPSCPNSGCVGPQNDYSLKFVDCDNVDGGHLPPDDLVDCAS